MTPDPIDRLSARLFEAARCEPPPEAAEQRALRAALCELRSPPAWSPARWGLGVSALLVAAGMAFVMKPSPLSERISAEPNRGLSSRPPLSGLSSAPKATSESSAQPALAQPRSSAPPASSTRAPHASLSDELAALKRASSALGSGDPRSALTELDRYDQVLRGSKLRAEATVLRIEALARSGKTQAASRLAQQFVEQNPGSPLVDRARSFLEP